MENGFLSSFSQGPTKPETYPVHDAGLFMKMWNNKLPSHTLKQQEIVWQMMKIRASLMHIVDSD